MFSTMMCLVPQCTKIRNPRTENSEPRFSTVVHMGVLMTGGTNAQGTNAVIWILMAFSTHYVTTHIFFSPTEVSTRGFACGPRVDKERRVPVKVQQYGTMRLK